MKKERNLYICYGDLAEDDKLSDLMFWRQASTEELFKATAQLCRTAERLQASREGRPEVTCIDKNTISYGPLKN